jgi:serine/threonine protein phosphatase PrpC
LEKAWDADDIEKGVRCAFKLLDTLLLGLPSSPSVATSASARSPDHSLDAAVHAAGSPGDRGASGANPCVAAAEKRGNPYGRNAPSSTVGPSGGSVKPPFAVPAMPLSDVPVSCAAPIARHLTDGAHLTSLVTAFHQGRAELAVAGGTTALVAIVLGGGGAAGGGDPPRLIVAHAGDSRAVVTSEGGAVVHCTVDHTVAARPEEELRIRNAGGSVDSDGRVDGTLSMTRSLGDLRYKTRGVSAEPTVTCLDLRQCQAVVLATDGLWQAVTTDEAAAIVRSSFVRSSSFPPRDTPSEPASEAGVGRAPRVASPSSPSAPGAATSSLVESRIAAERLLAEARLRNSSDDITVLVVDISAFGGSDPSFASPAAAALVRSSELDRADLGIETHDASGVS